MAPAMVRGAVLTGQLRMICILTRIRDDRRVQNMSGALGLRRSLLPTPRSLHLSISASPLGAP